MRPHQLLFLVLCVGRSAWAEKAVYRWVDDRGQPHYTDDRKSIPSGKKVTLTRGKQLGLLPSPSSSAPATGGPGTTAPDAPDGSAASAEIGVAPASVEPRPEATDAAGPPSASEASGRAKRKGCGCDAAAGGGSLIAIALGAASASRRRRR